MNGSVDPRAELWERRGLIEDLLARALDDWLDVAEFAVVAKRTGASGTEGVRALAIGLVAQVLVSGLMVAGDVDESGFVPWPESTDEAISKVMRLWDPNDASPTPGAVAWFVSTENGDRLGSAVLLRESIVEPDEKPQTPV